MSLWPSWLKSSNSSSLPSNPSYAAVQQNELDELPTNTRPAGIPAPTKVTTAPLGGRRWWHRLLLAIVLLLAAIYIVQVGFFSSPSVDTTTSSTDAAADTLPASDPYSSNNPFTDTLPDTFDDTEDDDDSKTSSHWSSEPYYDDETLASSSSSTQSAPVSAATSESASSNTNTTVQHGPAGDRKLRLLLPATRIDKHLCKTVFTATTMGYPKPILINWGMKPAEGEYAVSHLAKVGGIKDYLQSLGPEAADDLIVIADAIDLWFNLPAELLVKRYYEILDAENAYLEQLWGRGAVDNGIKATTVFAADKGCAGYWPRDHWCWLQPESTLPVDSYGNITGWPGAGYGRWTSFRPRYLNSGLVVGPLRDILALLLRTEDFIKAQHIDKLVFWQSDQRLILMAYAEQQLARNRKALENPQWRDPDTPPPENRTSPYATPDGTMNLDVHPDFDELDYTEIELQPGEQFLRYEYGITVDYASDLSHQTSSADHEWAYLRYDPTQDMEVPKLEDPRDCRVMVNDTIPADLAATPVPFAEIIGNSTHPARWEDLLLYTNLCSGRIPTVIHHNGDKKMREAEWPSLWFTQHGFDILNAAKDLAEANPDLDIGNGDAITDKGEHMGWKDLCWIDENDIFVEDLDRYSPSAMTYGVPPTYFPGFGQKDDPTARFDEDSLI